MDGVNKTLYIPLYGKSFVSKKGIILHDPKAEDIWEKEKFELKGKSKSKWLAYYMAMRAAVYDEWLDGEIKRNPDAVVLHIGCGMDSRIERVTAKNKQWYDIDFPDVIKERKKYYAETAGYRMLEADMRSGEWKKQIEGNQDAVIVMEGVSMYFSRNELLRLLSDLKEHFNHVNILMDCYTEKAAQISKYKNPINDVGVTAVFGYDKPEELALDAGLQFIGEHNMTPKKYIDELPGGEHLIFSALFAGKISQNMYRMYEFKEL